MDKGSLTGFFALAAVHAVVASAVTYATGNHQLAQVFGLSAASGVLGIGGGLLGARAGAALGFGQIKKPGAGGSNVIGAVMAGFTLMGAGGAVGYVAGTALPYAVKAFV